MDVYNKSVASLVVVNSEVKRNNKLIEELNKHNLAYQLLKLDFGDFVIITKYTTYIFLTDYLTNLTSIYKTIDSNHLRQSLVKSNGVPVMLIQTTDQDDIKSKLSSPEYMQALLKLMSLNILPIISGTPQRTIEFVINFLKEIGNEHLFSSFKIREQIEKDVPLKQQRLYLLSSLGVDVARALLEKYQSLGNLFRVLSTKNLMTLELSELEVNGRELGLRKAKRIADLFFD